MWEDQDKCARIDKPFINARHIIASSSDRFHELRETLTHRIFLVHPGKALNNDSDEDDTDNQFLQSEKGHSRVV